MSFKIGSRVRLVQPYGELEPGELGEVVGTAGRFIRVAWDTSNHESFNIGIGDDSLGCLMLEEELEVV